MGEQQQSFPCNTDLFSHIVHLSSSRKPILGSPGRTNVPFTPCNCTAGRHTGLEVKVEDCRRVFTTSSGQVKMAPIVPPNLWEYRKKNAPIQGERQSSMQYYTQKIVKMGWDFSLSIYLETKIYLLSVMSSRKFSHSLFGALPKRTINFGYQR